MDCNQPVCKNSCMGWNSLTAAYVAAVASMFAVLLLALLIWQDAARRCPKFRLLVEPNIDTGRVAFCGTENISTPNLSYAAQYLACALPCERFTSALADSRASLGAGAVRYSFTVTDFHRLPFAGLPAHPSTHDPLGDIDQTCHVAVAEPVSGPVTVSI